ncbi:MAG: hypothetical protein AMXMBFR56_72650 [Polyangiaceae bacterium]
MTKLATHSGQLERWLGKDTVEHLSASMRDWYGPPIAVGSIPGSRIVVAKGGDFRGRIIEGRVGTALDYVGDRLRNIGRAVQRVARDNAKGATLHAGFASVSEVFAAISAGKVITQQFQKAGATGVAAVTNSLWGLGALPAAGANASNAPGGDAPTDATTGAPTFTNPGGTMTTHFIGAMVQASLANTLLAYDRIFQVNKTMNSTANEAVTGVPSRYQNTTGGTVDSAEGNFLFVEVGGTALAATAHNWDTCLYTDQSNNASAALPTITGNSGAIVRRLDHPAGQWFAPLASGDTGVKALTQMHCSAAVATGVINFVIGHPLLWLPVPLVNVAVTHEGITVGGMNTLVRMFDDAAVAFLEVCKPATTATNYNVQLKWAYN